jgi:hypothetical protein
MANTKETLSEATVTVSYSKSAVMKIKAKSSFEFELEGTSCRCWFGASGALCFNAPSEEGGKQLQKLMAEVERLIHDASCDDLDRLDARRFLSKLMQMQISIEEKLLKLPESQRRLVATDLRPIDIKKLSDEERCLLEVLQEQSEIAVAAAEKDGIQKERIPLTISKDMVEAKLEEKRRRKE